MVAAVLWESCVGEGDSQVMASRGIAFAVGDEMMATSDVRVGDHDNF